MITNPILLPKIRSRALLDAIRGMPCSLRVSSFYPGHRCAAPETVVGCHLPVIGKGVASKVSDLFVAAGCQHCHDILDGRDSVRTAYIRDHYPTAFMDRLLQGLAETQARWIGMGLLVADGQEIV